MRGVARPFLSLLLLTAVLLLAPPAAKAATEVLGIRLGVHPDKTRVVLDLSDLVSYRTLLLRNPYRLVVDLQDATWNLASDGPLPGRGLVASLRYGPFALGTQRLVLDLNGPVALKQAGLIPGAGPVAMRLVLDLVVTAPGAFQAGSTTQNELLPPAAAQSISLPAISPPPAATAAAPAAPEPFVPAAAPGPFVPATAPEPFVPAAAPEPFVPIAETPAPAPAQTDPSDPAPSAVLAAVGPVPTAAAPSALVAAAIPLPGVKPAAPSASRGSTAAQTATSSAPAAVALLGFPPPIKPPAPERAKVPLVMIDPGHGGADPGTIGTSGLYEKTLTLMMARELKRQLEATRRYRIQLTRDDDVFVPLRDRIAIARAAHADLFISLHADSHDNAAQRGATVYTLSETASDAEAAALAAKENKSDLIAGVDLSNENEVVTSILIDLAQRETKNQSARLAEYVVQEMARNTLLNRNTHRFAGFAVLKAPDVPSVLIELGYLSNAKDEKLLRTSSYRHKLGTALVRALDDYFRWQLTLR
ncbi:MAG: N-acetylmuramoyl-L-alanine amidase [Pseudomonadota bacterium]